MRPTDVIKVVATQMDVPTRDLYERNRRPIPSDARCIAIYIMVMRMEWHVGQIATILDRDHSTICYNLRRFDALYVTNPAFRKKADAVLESIFQRTPR